MDDEQIFNRGGDDRDVKEYANINGGNLNTENMKRVYFFNGVAMEDIKVGDMIKMNIGNGHTTLRKFYGEEYLRIDDPMITIPVGKDVIIGDFVEKLFIKMDTLKEVYTQGTKKGKEKEECDSERNETINELIVVIEKLYEKI